MTGEVLGPQSGLPTLFVSWRGGWREVMFLTRPDGGIVWWFTDDDPGVERADERARIEARGRDMEKYIACAAERRRGRERAAPREGFTSPVMNLPAPLSIRVGRTDSGVPLIGCLDRAGNTVGAVYLTADEIPQLIGDLRNVAELSFGRQAVGDGVTAGDGKRHGSSRARHRR